MERAWPVRGASVIVSIGRPSMGSDGLIISVTDRRLWTNAKQNHALMMALRPESICVARGAERVAEV